MSETTPQQTWRHSIAVMSLVAIALATLVVGLDQTVSPAQTAVPATEREQSAQQLKTFFDELHTIIADRHWEALSDTQLAANSIDAANTVLDTAITPPTPSSQQAATDALVEALLQQPTPKRAALAAQIGDVMLAQLRPAKRSRLFTTTQTKNLVNRVNNVDPTSNPYETLGVSSDASPETIKQRYEQQHRNLSKQNTETARQRLAQLTQAYETVATPERRTRYNMRGSNPTVIATRINPAVLHLRITTVAPTTLQELQEEAQRIEQQASPELTSIIIDLRGNEGGSMDLLPHLLGPFIGPNNIAFELFRQDERTPFETKTGWLPALVRYKKVVILTDEKTQSSAELMAAALKRYNVGVLVGTTTRGWGTIETIIPLKTKLTDKTEYTAILVTNITLRPDGQPIEGRGIDPHININDPNWRAQLEDYHPYPPLLDAVSSLL